MAPLCLNTVSGGRFELKKFKMMSNDKPGTGWEVAVRPPGEIEYLVLPGQWPSLEAADLVVVSFVQQQLEEQGLLWESCVLHDGELDHEHEAPRRLMGWN
jgi:hypothetical protein